MMKTTVLGMMLVGGFAAAGEANVGKEFSNDIAIHRNSLPTNCQFVGGGEKGDGAFNSPVFGQHIPGIPKGYDIRMVSGLSLAGESDLMNPGVDSLRDLAADRPDATESPVTVDRGRWQVEMSVVDYAKDFQFEAWTWAETNLKYGLTDTMDLQFVFAPYIEERVDGETVDGASDLTIRLKWNLWGNDGGKSAFALFPYVKVPTDTGVSNGEWEGGLILPFAYEINEKWGFGCQAEFAAVHDGASYDVDVLHTAVVGYSVTDKIGVYGEYLGIAGDRSYEAYASGGVTYAVNPMFQLDAGAVIGLNDPAVDLNLFTGFTVKF